MRCTLESMLAQSSQETFHLRPKQSSPIVWLTFTRRHYRNFRFKSYRSSEAFQSNRTILCYWNYILPLSSRVEPWNTSITTSRIPRLLQLTSKLIQEQRFVWSPLDCRFGVAGSVGDERHWSKSTVALWTSVHSWNEFSFPQLNYNIRPTIGDLLRLKNS